ncbi:TonB-dependent receptor domain-containing protein [Allosphingosinicella vermicomposti]|uniref:TonB-dependent receptor domain-containing protein n=1 Tax=Allosphingosinicella vermicomposti TaxID=614671 RepID=UPI000D105594|nr:TonB-dependent receptor [Allosphingosinicella vermicomposti]
MKHRVLLLSACALPAIANAQVTAEEDAIVVTGVPLVDDVHDVATPVTVIAGDDLVHRRQATIGETLASEPGINADTFGGGASRPVIRGQTSPRVRVLADGAEIQDASAISPDHAIAAEPLLLRRIEILRGPSALLYGGGAIGGAVNLIDEKVPTEQPKGGIDGVVELRAGSNDEERAAVGGITVGLGNFALRAEGVYRDTENYRVPDLGEVAGSYNKSRTATLGGSWVGDDGYFGVAYTRQRSEYGLPGHSHEYEGCHPHGSSIHCGGHDDADDDHGHEEEEHHEPPYVKLRSDRFDIRGEYRNPIAAIESVRLRAGITDYEHDEIEHAEDGHDHDHAEDGVATTFKNKGYDARLEVEHAPIGGLNGIIGVQTSRSKFSALGSDAFLPESTTHNTGLFLMERLGVGPVTLELAARQDWQKIETTLDREAEHSPLSLSGAAIWESGNGYSVAFSLSRSQRAPNTQELFARGVHLATNTYELGDAALDEETSLSAGLTFRKTTGATTFTFGLFHNDFDGYIFADTLDRFEDFRLIRYTQADARFTGIDGEITHEFGSGVAVTLLGDYVRAKLKDGLGNVPRIPAGRLGARVEGGTGPLHADLEYYRTFGQDSIADFETETGGYNMVNATIAYRLPVATDGKTELFVRATNLLDERAYNHASFIKEAAPLRGRNLLFGLRAGF